MRASGGRHWSRDACHWSLDSLGSCHDVTVTRVTAGVVSPGGHWLLSLTTLSVSAYFQCQPLPRAAPASEWCWPGLTRAGVSRAASQACLQQPGGGGRVWAPPLSAAHFFTLINIWYQTSFINTETQQWALTMTFYFYFQPLIIEKVQAHHKLINPPTSSSNFILKSSSISRVVEVELDSICAYLSWWPGRTDHPWPGVLVRPRSCTGRSRS